ncbi:MAG: PAS domain-containing protein [Nanoarchaeota archaeon]|nr:PAS domain-containing protein [Nanoarchaeota archaeon]
MRKSYMISIPDAGSQKNRYNYPRLNHLFLFIIIIIFAEFIVMILISKLNLPIVFEAFVDSCILGAMLIPIFYQYLKKRDLAELKFKESRNQLERIFEGTGDAMRIIDKNFKIIKANKEMSNMAHVKKEKQIGMKCYSHLGSKYCRTKNCSLKKIMAGTPLIREDILRKRHDGTKFWAEYVASPLNDVSGNRIGIIESFRDISERKAIGKKLQEQLAELEKWEQITVGRELKMVELKKKLKDSGSKR